MQRARLRVSLLSLRETASAARAHRTGKCARAQTCVCVYMLPAGALMGETEGCCQRLEERGKRYCSGTERGLQRHAGREHGRGGDARRGVRSARTAASSRGLTREGKELGWSAVASRSAVACQTCACARRMSAAEGDARRGGVGAREKSVVVQEKEERQRWVVRTGCAVRLRKRGVLGPVACFVVVCVLSLSF